MRGPCSGFDFSDKGYEVLRQIGTGQFGRALLVRQVSDNELRTAKIVDLSPLDETDACLAAQETNLLRRVQDNPYIVSLCDHFIYQNIYLVIIMEYCQGGDMARCIRSMRWANVRFKEAEVIVMLKQLLMGLECIHDRSILHRDLKPSNILLTADGRLQIADFGVSRQLDFALPNARTSIGTPQYMPPEMMMRRPYMFFSDMWSLGCVLYEMLTCRPAFDDAAPVQLAFRVCFTPPDAMEGQWSQPLRDIVHRLLNKEPEQRPKPSSLLAEPYLNGVPHPVTSSLSFGCRLSMVHEAEEPEEDINSPIMDQPEEDFLSSSTSVPDLCAPIEKSPLESKALVHGELMEFEPASSPFHTQQLTEDLAYCELILHRMGIILKHHAVPFAAAMLKAGGKWSVLNSMVENLTRAMCGGQEVGLVVREDFHQSILLEIIRANVKPLWESNWTSQSNPEVDGALDETVTADWLRSTSIEFGLGISLCECDLILRTFRRCLNRQRIALRDFLPCVNPVGMLSHAHQHVHNGSLPVADDATLRSAQHRVEHIVASSASALLDAQSHRLSADVEAALNGCSTITPGILRDILVHVADMREDAAESVCQFALKTTQGDIDMQETIRAISTFLRDSDKLSLHGSASSQPPALADEPHQILHSFYERGLNTDPVDAEGLHHAHSDVMFPMRSTHRVSDDDSSSYSRRINGGSHCNPPSDTSPLSISRVTTSPAELIPFEDHLQRRNNRLPLMRATTSVDVKSYTRSRKSRYVPSSSSADSAEEFKRPRATLTTHAPANRLKASVRRLSSGELRSLPYFQGEDCSGIVMVFPDGSWIQQRQSDAGPADEEILRAMLHSLKAHEKMTERVVRELQSLSGVQMQLQFAKSVGHEWLHMIRQILHKTLEEQQHRLVQAEYTLGCKEGQWWRENAARSIRHLSKSVVHSLRHIKNRLRALSVLVSPSMCSASELVGDVGIGCIEEFDRATYKVLNVLSSLKNGVEAGRFIDDVEARINRRKLICAHPRIHAEERRVSRRTRFMVDSESSSSSQLRSSRTARKKRPF